MKKGLIKLSRRVLFFLSVLLFVIVGGLTLWIYKLSEEIPDDRLILYFSHDAVTHIVDRYGHSLISLREDQKQIWVPLSRISRALQDAVIAAEDPSFFRHSGIDYRQSWESLKDNIRLWRLARGGSTITQQVAKNIFLSSEKTFSRKIKEYFIAKRMEDLLPKEKILEIYLNEVGWGYGLYGVELASRFYLDKHAGELNIAEGAFLSAMLRNPAYYNPLRRLDIVLKRQQLVLRLMLKHRLITVDEYDQALSTPLVLRKDKRVKRFIHIGQEGRDRSSKSIPCYARLMEGYLVRTFGKNLLFDVGLEVRTTLDREIQNRLEEVIRGVERDTTPFHRGFSRDMKIGFLIDAGNRVRAIGCTDMWGETVERFKAIYPYYDSYRFEVKKEEDIQWVDILLIDTGNRTV